MSHVKNKSPQDLSASEFPLVVTEKVRFRDLDSLGHVNNAVFVSYLEMGRVEILWSQEGPLEQPGGTFVLAHLSMDLVSEITWPGEVKIATAAVRIGRSSVTISQAIFQNDRCAAVAETVLVAMDVTTRRSQPLTDASIARFSNYLI